MQADLAPLPPRRADLDIEIDPPAPGQPVPVGPSRENELGTNPK